MSIFRSSPPPAYDKLVDAQTTAEAALATFESVVTDLHYANSLLSEVEAEEKAKAREAQLRAQAAFDAQVKNTAIAGRITALLTP